MDIGFIGLGRMGAGMATSLLKAHHEVAVYNRTRGKAGPLVAKGPGWPEVSLPPAAAKRLLRCSRTMKR